MVEGRELNLTPELGTISIQGNFQENLSELKTELESLGFTWDQRTSNWRSPGINYRDLIVKLNEKKTKYQDNVRQYQNLDLKLIKNITPRPHQKEALAAWIKASRYGVCVMPTGSGKTILAMMCLSIVKRSTLILVPTIDLMVQWVDVIKNFFGDIEVGMLGGGSHEIFPITVSTYDSAVIHTEKIFHKFGFLICDECHHLPAAQYQFVARASIAPFRLGLTATPERADGKESVMCELLGEIAYRAHIHELVDRVLAPYEVVSVHVQLTEQEKKDYDEARRVYVQFLKSSHIHMSEPGAWQQFLFKASRSQQGKMALKSYRLQKKLAQASQAKMSELWYILCRHIDDKIIIFTDDNSFAYQIGRSFLLPVITHQTKSKERQKFLSSFRSGDLKILVTSKVLNEGVDVPDASIGVVLSGSGAVREHVQRLGRILRHQEGKKAILYEIISANTSEYYVNQRRRQHDAYQRSRPIPYEE